MSARANLILEFPQRRKFDEMGRVILWAVYGTHTVRKIKSHNVAHQNVDDAQLVKSFPPLIKALKKRIKSLPHSIPLGDDADGPLARHLGDLEIDAEEGAAYSANRQWERAFQVSEEEQRRLIVRGPYGLDLVCPFLEFFAGQPGMKGKDGVDLNWQILSWCRERSSLSPDQKQPRVARLLSFQQSEVKSPAFEAPRMEMRRCAFRQIALQKIEEQAEQTRCVSKKAQICINAIHSLITILRDNSEEALFQDDYGFLVALCQRAILLPGTFSCSNPEGLTMEGAPRGGIGKCWSLGTAPVAVKNFRLYYRTVNQVKKVVIIMSLAECTSSASSERF
ncbi:hypothetical protein FB451DRAFT_1495195 [Mycena latifolia]|nr:hypothetical protein FB451DRAFT_1495195 [Mycena latifolia]